MSKINARFWVKEFNESVTGMLSDGTVQRAARVVMSAVNRKTDDNVEWSKFSPSGTFEIYVTQVEGGAFEAFRAGLGKDVLITMEVVEPTPA